VVQASPRIRIIIADDEPHFRQGLRRALETSNADIEVVGEAANGEEAIAQARQLDPDVVVLDIHMPVLEGISAARAISAFVPRARILMLTVSDSPEDVAMATKAGAAGYLLKERSLSEISDAVVSVAGGRPWPLAVG
jgi:DNA-binding NarL/FixJ family response regulator